MDRQRMFGTCQDDITYYVSLGSTVTGFCSNKQTIYDTMTVNRD